MKKNLTITLLALACTLPAAAQDWSLGVRTGPFVFGDFLERRLRPASGESEEPTTLTLSAATRAGLSVDIEHGFAPRWAVRLEGTFTRAPLTIEDASQEGTDIRAGDLDVTTFTLPLVFRINPRGSFRFHLYGGPAYAIYKFEAPTNRLGVGTTTRSEWGLIAGGGLTWQIRESFGIEGSIADIVTTSPFDEGGIPDAPGFDVPRPHNVHTTVGIRYRF
jgi:hypothetical protein